MKMKKKIENLLQQLKKEGKSISKKAIADILKVNLSTVYRNWQESFDEYLTPEPIPLNLLASLQKENNQLKAKIAALETQINRRKVIISTEQRKPSTHLLNNTNSKVSSDSWLHFQRRK
jgi:DNA-binding transcriptional MocR family regulator